MKKSKIYIFIVNGAEIMKFRINLEKLIPSDTINQLHFDEAAKSHAEILSKYTEQKVVYYERNTNAAKAKSIQYLEHA
jgi:hypothetical protein